MYGDRINQLDFRIAKILRYGRTRTMVGVDIYNSLNSSAILTYNAAYSPTGAWNTPVTVLTARLAEDQRGDHVLDVLRRRHEEPRRPQGS